MIANKLFSDYANYMEQEKLNQLPIDRISNYVAINITSNGNIRISRHSGYYIKKEDLERVLTHLLTISPNAFFLLSAEKRADVKKLKSVKGLLKHIK